VWRRRESAIAVRSGEINFIAAGQTTSGPVFIKSVELDALLSGKLVDAIPPEMVGPQIKAKGGAPTQYDWDAMWVEVVRILLHDTGRLKAAELRRRLLDWFSATGRAVPSDTMMKEKMRLLYAMFDAEDKKGR
jgi:hypothetical protein